MVNRLAVVAIGEVGKSTRRRGRRVIASSRQGRGGLSLLVPYVVLLAVVGIVPTGYAIYQSFLARSGSGFGGISAYHDAVTEFQFASSFAHIGLVLAVWLPFMVIGVMGLALMLHGQRSRLVGVYRFIYYLPGALAGMGNFVLWLFLLDPVNSPVRPILSWLGYSTLNQTAEPAHLPVIIALMLFFQGAGTWILVIYGGLNGIPEELGEAATIDGASRWQVTRWIKLPLVRPWIAYFVLLNVAYASQLFLEPQVLGLATEGQISPQWTPNQLVYTFAFQVFDVPAAAALSVILLAISLVIGVFITTRTGLFSNRN
ncbi:MAG: carbohydrate ABC transporter permease [Acidimicrobiales bacterium]